MGEPDAMREQTVKRAYDSTVARIAGNIAGHMLQDTPNNDGARIATESVWLARLIVEEVKRTEPASPAGTPETEG